MTKQNGKNILHFYQLISIVSLWLTILSAVPATATSRFTQASGNERLVNIEVKGQDFFEALDAIAEQLKIKIVYHGRKPAANRDILFVKLPLDQALSRITRLYGIESLATVYKKENNTLSQVDVYGHFTADSSGSGPSFQTQPRIGKRVIDSDGIIDSDSDEKALTLAQRSHLVAQSSLLEAETEASMRPLTAEQLEQLRKRSAEIEAEEKENTGSLSQEQLKQLKVQSQLIESEEQRDVLPLSSEQMHRLRENSARIQREME
jgi:hypothetical protein